jgi:hypothetical protein
MSEPTFTHDIFLSHSAKDKAALRPLPLRLDRGEGRGEVSKSPIWRSGCGRTDYG